MMIRYLALFCSLFWLLSSCSFNSVNIDATGKVKRVISGQTLEVIITSGLEAATVKIRLNGVNAPDFREEYWSKLAKTGLEQLLSQKSDSNSSLPEIDIELTSSQRDRYGRFIGYVWYDGVLINEKLIKQGYVLADSSNYNKYAERFFNAQEYARIMGLGIWNPENHLKMVDN